LNVTKNLDICCEFEQGEKIYRFKVNIYKQINGWDLSFKILHKEIPRLENLNVPSKLIDTVKVTRKGLVIINGEKSSGKTTTAAAFINYLHTLRYIHTVILTDVDEYLYKPVKGLVRQWRLNRDFISLKEAIIAATEEDVDVLFIYKFDRPDVIREALIAAEKGIIIVACMTTFDARRALTTITDVFPAPEKPYIKHLLVENLNYIVSQKLLLNIEETSLVPITELVFLSPEIIELIKEENFSRFDSILADSENSVTQTFDNSILKLFNDGIISEEVASKNLKDKSIIENREI